MNDDENTLTEILGSALALLAIFATCWLMLAM